MADEKAVIPDIYSDLFNIMENALGVNLILHKSSPPSKPGEVTPAQTVAILRFTPENWKLILMTGRNQLKKRELATGATLKIPTEILTPLGITEADW